MLNAVGKILTGHFINNPIFVIGAGRSGTSILLQALGEHSEILSSDRESPFIPYIGTLVHPFEYRHNLDYHKQSLATSLDYLYSQLRKISFECAFGKNYGLRNPFSSKGPSLVKFIKARYWCAKTFPNQLEAMGLQRLFPRIKFIYIHRNGCDVVNSRMKFRDMSRLSFEENCEVWAKNVEKYQYLHNMENALRIRQEDLASDPELSFRKILDFVGAPYDDGPEKFSKTTLIHSLNQTTKSNIDAQKALNERPRAYASWNDEQKRIFLNVCSEGMHKLGYELPF
jgi:hypothetical protein